MASSAAPPKKRHHGRAYVEPLGMPAAPVLVPKPAAPNIEPTVSGGAPSGLAARSGQLSAELLELLAGLRGEVFQAVDAYEGKLAALLAELPQVSFPADASDENSGQSDKQSEADEETVSGTPEERLQADELRGRLTVSYWEEEKRKEQMSRVRKSVNRGSISPTPSEVAKQLQATVSPTLLYVHRLQEPLLRLVSSRYFEVGICLLILSNTLFFGVEAEYMAAQDTVAGHPAFDRIGEIYTFAFLTELILRMAAYGLPFFWGPNYGWNWFDFLLVITSIVEMAVMAGLGSDNSVNKQGSNLTYVRMIRIVRTFRVLRILRVVSFFRPLRLLLMSVLNTLKSLFWTVLLLCLILYIVGVVLTQAALGHVLTGGTGDVETLRQYYGSVGRSIFTLFMSITNGLDWQNAVLPLSDISAIWVCFFIIYIAFSYFAVLNVVTGVFCTTAIESAVKDQEEILHEKALSKAAYIEQLTELFEDVDTDHSGELTIDEFEKLLEDVRLQRYCAALDLTIDDAWALFKLLDSDGSGAIGVDEFTKGCLRLQGAARGVDLALAMYQIRWIADRIGQFTTYTDMQFKQLTVETRAAKTTVETCLEPLAEEVLRQPFSPKRLTLKDYLQCRDPYGPPAEPSWNPHLWGVQK